MPHILGTAVGLGAMALGAVVGLAALVAVVPQIAFAMKVAGSVYLLYLAWQVAGAGALSRSAEARPLTFVELIEEAAHRPPVRVRVHLTANR